MFVHAHPDDESSKGAATMARYAAEGFRVSLVTCTDGAAGDILNPAMDHPGVRERLIELRGEELGRALHVLGVTDHHQLGYPDSGFVKDFDGDGSRLAPDCFYNAPVDEVVGKLVAVIRAEQPDVVVTYPEGGGYPHPDHIRCQDVTAAAFTAARDPERYPEAGAPWQPQKLYYFDPFPKKRLEELHAACLRHGIDSPYAEWLRDRRDSEPDPSTTQVTVGAYLGQRSQALLAHATQVDPDGPWFRVPDEVVAEAYPYEDFVLAYSHVETRLPESSLFAGLE
jgi:mycothiol S-conjugate amidase